MASTALQNEYNLLREASRGDYVVPTGWHATAHRLVRRDWLRELTHPANAFHVRITEAGREALAAHETK